MPLLNTIYFLPFRQPNAKIVDPLCTFLFSIIVMFTTVRLMRESIAIILNAVPGDLDVQLLHNELSCIPGVRSVHDLTVWSVSVNWPVMAVHLVVGECLCLLDFCV